MFGVVSAEREGEKIAGKKNNKIKFAPPEAPALRRGKKMAGKRFF